MPVMTDGIDRPESLLPSGVSLLIVATVAGTIQGFLIPYARHLRALGWRVDAAAQGATTNAALQDEFDHLYEIPLSRSILDLEGLVRGERAVAGLLRSGPDIVHVHTPIASFLTRVAVRGVPADRRPAVAYTAHGFHFYRGGRMPTNVLFRTAEEVAGRWTDRLVVINDEDYDAARRHRIVPRRRLVRMPGIGIDTAHYSRARIEPDELARARRELGVGPEVPFFVVVAEQNRNKRNGDIIAALAAMTHREAHLGLLGEGPERARLEALATELGVGSRVRFAGFVDDPRPVIASATALVLASGREGLARAVMEALALEVPVVASTARGNEELVTPDSGRIVPTGDVAGLAAAMDWIADHPDDAREMGVRGRARMIERYDLDILLRLHDEMYRDMLAERGRTG
jgi:glycosyltransferase involved in cell wall biosynthesis